ncbi:hypothetical protein C2845_PM05G15730 [Panicum miliaceum]|uniref:Peptidase C1A papain C-terminal domain-containing protein n=1 Tax=Panicum miliaceum TaxID=4540 RepID=A0A3L6SZ76_PANMI|nr:hypothetical protein C2845_PM05G15730 [Panicum miliaceum]
MLVPDDNYESFLDSRIEGFMYKDHVPPKSVDWVKKRVVTPPHVQRGQDCWAHAAVGAVEGINAIRTGKLIKLSEQQVLDCNNLSNGTYGYGYGYPHLAFDYIFRNGGLAPEALYPYVGKRGPCRKIHSEMVTIDGYQFVPKKCEFSLRQAVANQPISADIAFDERLECNTRGIIDDMGSCGKLNHSVLVVAYGATSKGRKFWIIKDSATEKLIYMARNVGSKGGAFGIARSACFPVKIVGNKQLKIYCHAQWADNNMYNMQGAPYTID